MGQTALKHSSVNFGFCQTFFHRWQLFGPSVLVRVPSPRLASLFWIHTPPEGRLIVVLGRIINTCYSSSHGSEWPTASTINPPSRPHSIAFEGTSPWQDVPEREKVARWDGARVTSPSLVPWLVMAGPPSALHYASALRQMEWSGIQLRKNKQVGSERLRRCIVSITAQAQATVMLSEKQVAFAFRMKESEATFQTRRHEAVCLKWYEASGVKLTQAKCGSEAGEGVFTKCERQQSDIFPISCIVSSVEPKKRCFS